MKDEIIKQMQDFLLEEPTKPLWLEDWDRCYEYELERWGKVANEFDGMKDLTILFLSVLCRRQIEHTACAVTAFLDAPGTFERYRRLRETLVSGVVAEIRASTVGGISRALGIASKGKMIGDASPVGDALDDAVFELFDEFGKLRFETYANSGRPVGDFEATSVSAWTSGSLAELLLRLERAPDGIYVGFVSVPGTLDGWFGFFCKSNGNLFSYNERIDEEYVGQHLRFRNGRYAEHGKAYGLFPYEMCKFSEERDYKGYSTAVEIGDNLNLLESGKDGFEVAIRMFLSMMLIREKHRGRPVDGTPVVLDSLIRKNLLRLKDSGAEKGALVKWEGSALVEANAAFRIPSFDLEKILNGEYDREFNGYGKEQGIFWGVNQDMVEAYCDGFKVDGDRILASDSALRLIGNGECSQEFVGSPGRMRLRAFYEVRQQLACYIEKRMRSDFNAFGGKEGLRLWFRERLLGIKDKIIEYCLDAYGKRKGDGDFWIVDYGKGERQFIPGGDTFAAEWRPMEVSVRERESWDRDSLSEFRNGRNVCPLSGKTANVFFRFNFGTYEQVRDFLGCELPKFCVGWHKERPYNGNSILNVTDPVGNIISPLYRTFEFSFGIALSKSGIRLAKRRPLPALPPLEQSRLRPTRQGRREGDWG